MQRPTALNVGVVKRQVERQLIAFLEVGIIAGLVVEAVGHEAAPEAGIHQILHPLIQRQVKIAPWTSKTPSVTASGTPWLVT